MVIAHILNKKSRFTPEFKILGRRFMMAVVLGLTVLALQGVALWGLDRGSDSTVGSAADGIYFVIVSIFGETSSPNTWGGRVITLISLFEGLMIATYLVALAAIFTIRGGQILMTIYSEYVVICGWNFQGSRIVEELILAQTHDEFGIVVIPGKEIARELEDLSGDVTIVDGSPSDQEVLVEAHIKEAKSAIILADPSHSSDDGDAKVLMTTLAVESVNSDVHTSAQLMNSENEIHLIRAGVDEIISLDLLGANMAVASALNPGVSKVVSELVHFDAGSEIYRLSPPLPSDVINHDFKGAMRWFIDHDMILVGVESADVTASFSGQNTSRQQNDQNVEACVGGNHQRAVSVNPRNHNITNTDVLFVISDNDPRVTLDKSLF